MSVWLQTMEKAHIYKEDTTYVNLYTLTFLNKRAAILSN